MRRVLVTDGLWRKSLSAVRALGRDGVEVTVTGDRWSTTSFFSRYCHRRLRLPAAASHPDQFLEGLVAELRRRSYDTVFAMEDATLSVVSKHREVISEYTNLVLPSHRSLQLAGDKAQTIALAESIGLPVPRTVVVDRAADLSLDAIRAPAVVKPARGSGSRGVRYVDATSELRPVVARVIAEHGTVLVQERIPAGGQGLGVGLLFDMSSQPVASFTYKRLREYPVSGGPSTLRESTHDSKLLDLATRLLRALDWVGVAMVEFKLDPRDGQSKLMEINPRFWGSLELAVASGVNFPVLLLKVATAEEFAPVVDYRTGVQCRWLVPGDILHFISNPDRFRLSPSFFQFRAPNLHYDDFAADDLGGSLGTVLASFVGALSPEMWKVAIRR